MSQDSVYQSESVEEFAVFRSGIRVSDSVYPDAFHAQRELNYWRGILKRWPDGTKVDVRKLHYGPRKTTTKEAV